MVSELVSIGLEGAIKVFSNSSYLEWVSVQCQEEFDDTNGEWGDQNT